MVCACKNINRKSNQRLVFVPMLWWIREWTEISTCLSNPFIATRLLAFLFLFNPKNKNTWMNWRKRSCLKLRSASIRSTCQIVVTLISAEFPCGRARVRLLLHVYIITRSIYICMIWFNPTCFVIPDCPPHDSRWADVRSPHFWNMNIDHVLIAFSRADVLFLVETILLCRHHCLSFGMCPAWPRSVANYVQISRNHFQKSHLECLIAPGQS